MAAWTTPHAQQGPANGHADLEVIPVRGKVYMIAGPAGNSAVQIGDDGTVVIDTMTAEKAPALVSAIRSIAPKAVIRVINTSIDPEHTGGNGIVGRIGIALADARAVSTAPTRGAPIVAHENVLNKMVSENGPYKTDSDRWPTESYFNRQKDLFINDEPVQLFLQPAAHTDGDTLVMFRRSDVLVTGDLFTPERYPVVNLELGGSINGLIAALNRILDLTVPALNEEGGTMVIPGHGRLCDEADVSEYRDMVTIVRDRVQEALKKRMSLADVKAARFTADYDALYGTPSYSGDMFVEAVYRSLSQAQKPVNPQVGARQK